MKGISVVGLVAALLATSGCGPDTSDLPATVPAQGVVLLDGEPVDGASVVFAPIEPGKYPAFAMSDSKGRIDLRAFEAKSGAVPGSYQVQVTKTIEVDEGPPSEAPAGGDDDDAEHAAESTELSGIQWKNALPEKYNNPIKSEIVVDIPEDGRTDIEIKLVPNP